MKRVKAFTKKKGERVFNLASDNANNDWIRSARLLREGRIDELRELESQPTYYRPGSLLRMVKKLLKK